MKKLSNYIFNGKGFGVLALFILALIVGGVFGLALKEIGDAIGKTAERVRQIKENAIAKMRSEMAIMG